MLTGSFSCWRKWCTRSIFFTLPLCLTKNSRTEAWVIPSLADMLNLCGTGWISPSLLSEQIPLNTDDIFRHHHNYVQMHAGSSWSPRTSRGASITCPRNAQRHPRPAPFSCVVVGFKECCWSGSKGRWESPGTRMNRPLDFPRKKFCSAKTAEKTLSKGSHGEKIEQVLPLS